uniref:Uncharacterized protein n=1 Tax=Oryza rufipogon TaxID=4529 RepID=A0A0E0R465_ORYRU
MAREISLAPTAAVEEPAAAPARVRRRRQLHLFSVAAEVHEVSVGERRERGGGADAGAHQEPADGEASAGKKRGIARRNSEEVSLGCRGAGG